VKAQLKADSKKRGLIFLLIDFYLEYHKKWQSSDAITKPGLAETFKKR